MAWGNPGYPQAGGVTIIPLPSGALEFFGPDGASLGTITPGAGMQTLAQVLATGNDANGVEIANLGAPQTGPDSAARISDTTLIGLPNVLGNSNDADGYSITDLGAPTNPNDAARLTDIPVTPDLGTVLGAGADAGGTAITNLGAPSNPSDAARLEDALPALSPLFFDSLSGLALDQSWELTTGAVPTFSSGSVSVAYAAGGDYMGHRVPDYAKCRVTGRLAASNNTGGLFVADAAGTGVIVGDQYGTLSIYTLSGWTPNPSGSHGGSSDCNDQSWWQIDRDGTTWRVRYGSGATLAGVTWGPWHAITAPATSIGYIGVMSTGGNGPSTIRPHEFGVEVITAS